MLMVGGAMGVLMAMVFINIHRYGPMIEFLSVWLNACVDAAVLWVISILYSRAMTDELTGVSNRRALFHRLYKQINKSRKSHTPSALIVIDVDKFRQYNSNYGHLTGDRVLRAVASVIKTCVRKGDLVGRWGGEEFAILLPHTSLADAHVIAERLRVQVEGLELDPDGSTMASRKLGITISVGVAFTDTSRVDATSLIRNADIAMYRAKVKNNCVVIVTDPLH